MGGEFKKVRIDRAHYSAAPERGTPNAIQGGGGRYIGLDISRFMSDMRMIDGLAYLIGLGDNSIVASFGAI